MRVGQESHVVDHVRVHGNAVLETEAHDLEPGCLVVARTVDVPDPVSELVHVEVGGVDDHVGIGAQVAQHPPFLSDGLDDAATALQRQRPPRRLLPTHDRDIAGLEIADLAADALHLELGETAGQLIEHLARSHVQADGDSVLSAAAGGLDELGEHTGRQVVDDEPAEVFHRVGGGTAPAQSGDDDNARGRGFRLAGGLRLAHKSHYCLSVSDPGSAWVIVRLR